MDGFGHVAKQARDRSSHFDPQIQARCVRSLFASARVGESELLTRPRGSARLSCALGKLKRFAPLPASRERPVVYGAPHPRMEMSRIGFCWARRTRPQRAESGVA